MPASELDDTIDSPELSQLAVRRDREVRNAIRNAANAIWADLRDLAREQSLDSGRCTTLVAQHVEKLAEMWKREAAVCDHEASELTNQVHALRRRIAAYRKAKGCIHCGNGFTWNSKVGEVDTCADCRAIAKKQKDSR